MTPRHLGWEMWPVQCEIRSKYEIHTTFQKLFVKKGRMYIISINFIFSLDVEMIILWIYTFFIFLIQGLTMHFRLALIHFLASVDLKVLVILLHHQNTGITDMCYTTH